MSSLKIDTKNILISEKEVAKTISDNKKYEELDSEQIQKIVVKVFEKARNEFANTKGRELVLDDEKLFDETYDYILKKLGKEMPSAEVAYVINDLFMQMEDILFDQGKLQYEA